MAYFSNEFVTFFKELEKNNEKSWFDENRKRYDTHVKKSFNQFLESAIAAIGQVDPDITIAPKEAVFRINRDIRFSKDKTPYKTHMAAVISSTGRKNLEVPGIYIQFSASNTYIGGGSHSPSKSDLYNIRHYIMNHYDEYKDLVSDSNFVKLCGEIKGEKNKILPADFKEAAESIPELYNKQFYFMNEYKSKDVLFKDDLIEFFVEHFLAAKPFNDFLNRARHTNA